MPGPNAVAPSAAPARRPGVLASKLSFDDLRSWRTSSATDLRAAVDVFEKTASALPSPAWDGIRHHIGRVEDGDLRGFLEQALTPVVIGDPGTCLLTGYFEPEVQASRNETERFSVPLHGLPDATYPGALPSRAEIEDQDALGGQAPVIAWVSSRIERFMLQVQGSARLVFEDGNGLRIGYAGRNGHPYRSIGREMVRQGLTTAEDVCPEVIRAYVDAHPDAGSKLMQHNPSYVFFQARRDLCAEVGPIGAMGQPVHHGVSCAVDPDYVTLGGFVWIERANRSLDRLWVAQDIGSAIKGPQRADLFAGTGPESGRAAGQIQESGRLVQLLPRATVEPMLRA